VDKYFLFKEQFNTKKSLKNYIAGSI